MLPTTQQSPLDKARLKVMDTRRRPMPCPIPDWTRAVTYRDRMAHLRLALCSPNSLRSRELAKYKI